MGPRHRCRGIYRGTWVPPHFACFNGATASLPWNRLRQVGQTGPARWRFNGATASLPWNQAAGRAAMITQSLLQWGHGIAAVESISTKGAPVLGYCFNGATASLPWNQSPGLDVLMLNCMASMGPRHRCRGIKSRRTCNGSVLNRFNGATASLPWNQTVWAAHPLGGCGFNGATASLPWNLPVAGDFRVSLAQASMGPRHRCRGISPHAAETPQSSGASMGPRHRCRGIYHTDVSIV